MNVYLFLPGKFQFFLLSLHLFLSLLFHFNFLKLQFAWIYTSFAIKFCREELSIRVIQRCLKSEYLYSLDFFCLKGTKCKY